MIVGRNVEWVYRRKDGTEGVLTIPIDEYLGLVFQSSQSELTERVWAWERRRAAREHKAAKAAIAEAKARARANATGATA